MTTLSEQSAAQAENTDQTSGRSPLKGNSVQLKDAVIYGIAFFWAVDLLVIAAGKALSELGVSFPTRAMVLTAVFELIGILLMALRYRELIPAREDPEMPYAFPERTDKKSTLPIAAVVTILAALAGSCLAWLLESMTGSMGGVSYQSFIAGSAEYSEITVFIAIVIIIPIFEELAVRGFLYRYMRSRYGFLVSAVVTSVMWSLCHNTILQAVSSFILGMAFAYSYETTRKISVPIVFHAVNNFIAFLGAIGVIGG